MFFDETESQVEFKMFSRVYCVFTGRSCDAGESYISTEPDSPATAAFQSVVQSKF